MDRSMTIQDASVALLDSLSDRSRELVVDAGSLPTPTTEACSNDYLHGKGCCYGPSGDALCLPCQMEWIARFAEPGDWLCVDVTA